MQGVAETDSDLPAGMSQVDVEHPANSIMLEETAAIAPKGLNLIGGFGVDCSLD